MATMTTKPTNYGTKLGAAGTDTKAGPVTVP
jgi:hypothetical protein